MRIFNRFRTAILSLFVGVASLLLGGCSMTADNTLGSDIMPEGQVMVMRHLKYQGNTKIYFNAETDKNESVDLSQEGKNLIETRLYRTDSLLSSDIGSGYMGVRRSDVFGLRTAGFASTMLYMNAIDEENGFGYKPIFDTMKLLLSVTNYGGDTLTPIRYKVYELKKPLAEGAFKYDDRRADSVAYINCDLSALYDESKPIFEFTFPNEELTDGISTVLMPMERTEYSWDFARRLMLIPDNYADAGSDWDGYGRSGIECYQDDKKWVDKIYGLYIKPDVAETPADKEGAVYEIDLSASGIMLQGRSRNPKDPSMIKDTVGMYYYFLDSESSYNASLNKVEHDYTKGLQRATPILGGVVMDASKSREERTLVSTCYVEGMGGPATEIYFTDDFLEELVKLETTENDNYSKMGINQCLLTIYVDGADYDWSITQGNSAFLTPLLDGSLTRLGSYLNYNTFSPIIDYDYIYENNYETEIPYSGYLDRSRGCYVLNITAHIQKLFSSLRKNDGTYDVSAVDESLRVVYIGVEATTPYSLKESVLQGMERASSSDLSASPIQIDLTYTLIK